jgi:predicted Zn-dependent protease
MQIGTAVASIAAAAYGGSQLGQMVGQGAQVGSQMIQAKYGRGDELEADQYGMKYMKLSGYDLSAAVSLQELFVRKFKAGNEQDWMTGLFASHPPSEERVAANRKTMAELGGAGGELGAERFKTAIAGLKRAAPAYAKYDQAIAVANKKDLAGAKRLANEAVALEPRESRFYGLLADLELVGEDARAALGWSEKAMSRDPGYFKPHLQSGVAHFELGERAAAEPPLSRSMELLPTAPAAYYLGRVNEDSGDRADAVKYYKMIASPKSTFGRDALDRLSRLDGGQHLEAYLSIEPRLDEHGRIALVVGNRLASPLTDVSILVGIVDRSGRTVEGPTRVSTGGRQILPQKGMALRSSLGPYKNAEVLRYVRWKVESARVAQ